MGAFPGMLARRRFDVVRVSRTPSVGFSFEPLADRLVDYRGAPLEVTLR